MKTSELIGPALDWAVAKCEGIDNFDCMGIAYVVDPDQPHFNNKFSPSTKWSQGGPIIEREKITVSALYAQKNPPSPAYDLGEWGAYIPCGVSSEAAGSGPTLLIAAMRCYVASKLGDEIEMPEELK